MDNFYELLGCEMNDDLTKIKSALRSQQLQFHPDKCQNLTTSEQLIRKEKFYVLERAWRVLKDLDDRQRYNAILAQYQLQASSAGCPIQTELLLSEFLSNFETKYLSEVKSSEIFSAPCRCGGEYVLEGVAVLAKIPYAYCFQCSLAAKVIYDNEETLKN